MFLAQLGNHLIDFPKFGTLENKGGGALLLIALNQASARIFSGKLNSLNGYTIV